MAKTASMTTSEAEAELGSRGHLVVNSDNRRTVRKWLNAQGFPSLFSGGLSMRELALAYNDTTGDTLDKLRKKLAEAGEGETPDADASPASETPAPDASKAWEPAPNGGFQRKPVASKSNTDAANQIAQAVAAALAGVQGGSDPEEVRAIVDEALTARGMSAEAMHAIIQTGLKKTLADAIAEIGIVRMEVKLADREIVKLDGPQHYEMPRLVRQLAAGNHVYLCGPAGSGKTTAASNAATAVGRKFYLQPAISGTHELLGWRDASGFYHTTPFRQAFEHGGTICLDEIDAGDAGAVNVINGALANSHYTFPDNPEPIARHPDFIVVACANTFGNGADRLYVGRTQLDAATLDRFYFIPWNYDEKLERAICPNVEWVERVQKYRRGADKIKARVVISPRASIMGAKALAAGDTVAQAEEALIWKGMDSELKSRILQAA
jgi:cobaltochelatase CobS